MEIVAIPVDEESRVDQRFGHAVQFKIYTIQDDASTTTETITFEEHGHTARVNKFIEMGVTYVICGNIGNPAIAGLQEAGIEVYTSINGDVDRVIEQWMKGALPHIITGHEPGAGCGGHH